MLKQVIFLLPIFLIASYSAAQIYDPVTWSFKYEKVGENKYDIIITATIEENSHIYAMDIPEGGPIPTSFQFDTIAGYVLEGKPYEVTEPVEKFDEAFGFKIKTLNLPLNVFVLKRNSTLLITYLLS